MRAVITYTSLALGSSEFLHQDAWESDGALSSWGGRNWLQVGGRRDPLDGGFIIEWGYISAELRRSKIPSILSEIQSGVPCKSAYIRMLSGTEPFIAQRALFLGIAQIDINPLKTISKG